MKGKIIVVTGIDGSGKNTQADLLFKHLKSKGLPVAFQSFPNYESDSAKPVNMYLQKKLCEHANDLNPYQATQLFITDFICTMKKYEKFLDKGGILVLDRYLESNFIHQAGKFQEKIDQIRFINNIKTQCYRLMKLPRPDLTLYLDCPLNICRENIIKRENENPTFKSGSTKDIHEQDFSHLTTAYNMGQFVADHEKWTKIPCANKDGKQRSISSIHNNIKNVVENYINKDKIVEMDL